MAPTMTTLLAGCILALGASAQTTTAQVASTSTTPIMSTTHQLDAAQSSHVRHLIQLGQAHPLEHVAAHLRNHTTHDHAAHGGTITSTLSATTPMCTTTVFPKMHPISQTYTTYRGTVFYWDACSAEHAPLPCITETLHFGHGPRVKFVKTTTMDFTTMKFPCGPTASTWTEQLKNFPEPTEVPDRDMPLPA